jgi:hypothetical protein
VWSVKELINKPEITFSYTYALDTTLRASLNFETEKIAPGEYKVKLKWTDVPPSVSSSGQIVIKAALVGHDTFYCEISFFLYEIKPAASVTAPDVSGCPSTITLHQLWVCRLYPDLNQYDRLSKTTIEASNI